MARWKKTKVIPGFGLSMGVVLLYLSLIVIIPLATVFVKSFDSGLSGFMKAAFSQRVVAGYKVSLLCSFIAASVNSIFGIIISWVLVRYDFPCKRIIDGFIDLPFALPTAVAGISLTTLFAKNGWIGQFLYSIGIQSIHSKFGISMALVFIGIPFVVRTIQPVLEDLDIQYEEAAIMLGADRIQIFFRVIVPEIFPALLTGFALAFARGLGEYGSVIFIAGNQPMKTEIAPLLIMSKLGEYDYSGATAIAIVMLFASFMILLLINILQALFSKFSK
ncbi:MAG: sulfate ABC transporter permease subunit CysT [Cellulosilyticum sp.]|nr:sulfate ABC transporter permease subunit CysT [Cellulosilyticum sp.]